MKRGNTALKRGVGLASAFALAIAGAVIAAPAASATPAAADSIRATPTADANYVKADGSASDSYVGNAPYSASTPTGTTVLVKPTGTQQSVSDFQIVVPALTTSNGTVSVTLSTGATFSAPPVVDVDRTERVLTSFNTSAGYDRGANAHVAAAVAGGVTLPANAIGQPAWGLTHDVVTFSVSGVTASTGGYVLSFKSVKVDTSAAATGPVTATVSSTGTLTGVTTLAYVVPASVTASAAVAEADGNGGTNGVKVPDLVVSENVAGAFTIAGDVVLTVSASSGNIQTGNVTLTDAKATASGTALAVAAAPTVANNGGSAVDITVDVTTASTAAGKVTLSGLALTGVNKNATINVAIKTPVTTGTASNGPGAFSFVKSLSAASTSIETTVPEPRIAGANRYATAAKVLDAGITASTWTVGSTNAVVIANGETAKQGADALSASYLAAAVGAPILLTAANSLPNETQAALIKLFKGYNSGDITVYVLGKTDSVSQAVRDQIASIVKSTAGTLPAGKDVKVVEIAGSNRYSTSAAAATEGGTGALDLHSLEVGKGWLRTAFLASGTVNADALAAAAVSAGAGIPVFLTNGSALDDKVAAAIKDLGITQVIVLGGTDRVSQAVVDGLSAIGVTNTKRIAGANRDETAAAIAAFAYADVNPTGSETNRGLQWTGSTVYIANSAGGFADALAVGPLAGDASSVVLTTAGGDKLAKGAADFLDDENGTISDVWALGQTDRVSSSVLNEAVAALK